MFPLTPASPVGDVIGLALTKYFNLSRTLSPSSKKTDTVAYWIYFGFVVALIVVNLIGIAIAGWLQTAFATTGTREVCVVVFFFICASWLCFVAFLMFSS
jgi:hypothetical protein